MGVRRTALLTFCDSGKRVASILMICWPELDFAARCATTKHTVSASLHLQSQLMNLPITVLRLVCSNCCPQAVMPKNT